MQVILSSVATTTVHKADGSQVSDFLITIEKIVFNEVALFNINYFNTESTYTVGTGAEQITVTASESNKAIKESITKMFMICRILAMVIALLVLIYIGIRMALASVASDKAKYKNMLIAWVQSIAIMFLMVYIMVIIVGFGESLTNIFFSLKDSLLAGKESFEVEVTESITRHIFETSGLKLATYSIIYWIVIYSQFKFFYLYIKRVLMVGFLIMISPLITITYSIDKAGDGKAQAFGTWFSEFLMNVLIQPLHALLYLIFVFSANEIATISPVVAVIFMLGIGSAERMVKVIFNMRGLVSLRGINKFRKQK